MVTADADGNNCLYVYGYGMCLGSLKGQICSFMSTGQKSLIKISGSDERSDTAVLYLDLLRCQMQEMCIEGLGGCPTWNVSLKFSFLFSVGFASIFSPLTEVLFSLSLILLPRLCFPCFLSSQASVSSVLSHVLYLLPLSLGLPAALPLHPFT